MHKHTYKNSRESDVKCVEQVDRPAPTLTDGCIADNVRALAVLHIVHTVCTYMNRM